MKLTPLMALLTSAGLCSPLFAAEDQAPPPDDVQAPKVQRVEITGSSIKRVDQETAAPVEIITRQQITDMGATTLSQVMNHISANVKVVDLVDTGSGYTASEGGSAANLRGLGPQATLTLLNGRRLSSFGATYNSQYQFVNIDAIPVSAIERVEVLADGASAIYGSDAIAGVINIITKDSYNGLELSADAQKPSKTHGGREYNGAISYGVGDLASDKYNVFGTLSFYQRDRVGFPDGMSTIQPTWLQYHKGFLPNLHMSDGTGPGVINPGTLYAYGDDATYRLPAAGCTTVTGADPTYRSCARNSAPTQGDMLTSSKRANLFVSGHFDLGNSIEAFSEVSASRIEMHGQFGAPWLDDYPWSWYARNTGYKLQTFVGPYLSPTNPYNTIASRPDLQGNMGGVAGLDYTFLDDPNYSQHQTTDTEYRVVGGLRGARGDFNWSSAVTIAGTHTTQWSQGYNPSPSGFLAALGPYTTDASGNLLMSDHPAYQFGTTNATNRALMYQMFPRFTYESGDKIINWDGKISDKITTLAGGDMMYAVGASYGYEKYDYSGDPRTENGDVAWQGGSWWLGSRSTKALYGELVAPVSKKLELNVAVRDDKYENFDNNVVFKLGATSKVSDALLLRGTMSQGFRAPSLVEQGTGGSYAVGSVNDSVRCKQTDAIANVLLASSKAADIEAGKQMLGSQCSGVNMGQVLQPNPNLKPETANIATLGFVLNPSKLFDISADYFFISRKNEIVPQSTSDVLQQAIAEHGEDVSSVPGVFVRNDVSAADHAREGQAAAVCAANPAACPHGAPVYTVGTMAGMIVSYVNQTRTLVDGFDIQAHAHFKLDTYGKLDLGWQSTIKRRMMIGSADGGWGPNQIGSYDQPRVTGTFTAKWTRGDYDVALTGDYTGHQSLTRGYNYYADSGYENGNCYTRSDISPAQCDSGLGANTYWTANFGWRPVKNLTLNLNLQNLFNRQPAYDPRSWNYGVNDFAERFRYGRLTKLSANYQF